MSLTDLISEIENIGTQKLEEMEKQLANALKAVEDKYTEKKAQSIKNIEKKAVDGAAKVKERTEMLANAERRKQILAKKRELIDQIFDNTLSALVDSPNYKKYIESSIKKAQEAEKEGEITYAKGKKAETEEVIANTQYKLGEEGTFLGGFVLKTGKVEYDFTFDSVIEKKLRGELETKVANILF